MTTLYALMHDDWWLFFVGCCALAVIFAILKSINGQDKSDILPPPRCDLIARGGKDAWTVTLINKEPQ